INSFSSCSPTTPGDAARRACAGPPNSVPLRSPTLVRKAGRPLALAMHEGRPLPMAFIRPPAEWVGMIEDLFTLPTARRRQRHGHHSAFADRPCGTGCHTVFLGALADEDTGGRVRAGALPNLRARIGHQPAHQLWWRPMLDEDEGPCK